MGVSARLRGRDERFAMRTRFGGGRRRRDRDWLSYRVLFHTFGLEFAEFGGALVEQAVGLGAGAVDGVLDFVDVAFGGFHGVHDVDRVVVEAEEHASLDLTATAETPCGAADFFDESVFEGTDRGEFAFEIGLKFGVVGFFRGADEVASGEETEGDAVEGGCCFACFGAGTGGGLSVALVGCDLSGCGHFRVFLSGCQTWLPDFRKAWRQVGFCGISR